jgi:hypothetical protein
MLTQPYASLKVDRMIAPALVAVAAIAVASIPQDIVVFVAAAAAAAVGDVISLSS